LIQAVVHADLNGTKLDVATAINKRASNVATYKSGAAGYDVHGWSSRLRLSYGTAHRSTGIWPHRLFRLADKPLGVNSTNTCQAWDSSRANLFAERHIHVARSPESVSGQCFLLLLPR